MLPEIEAAIRQDQAIYEAAGLLPVRCEWCGDRYEPDDRRLRHDRYGNPFCSDYCRRAWRRAEGPP